MLSRIVCQFVTHSPVLLLVKPPLRYFLWTFIFSGIGQPLSMLLKLNPAVTKLNLYDIVHTPGVAADLSHIETKAKVQGFVGPDQVGLR